MRSSVRVLLVAILGAGAMPLWSQPTAPTTRPATRAASTRPLRDPTQPDARLRQAMEPAQPAEATVARQAQRLPQITRRGFLQIAGEAPEALLEVQGAGIHQVKEGSLVTVTLPDERTLVLRVGRIASDAIEIEFTTLKETILVR